MDIYNLKSALILTADEFGACSCKVIITTNDDYVFIVLNL